MSKRDFWDDDLQALQQKYWESWSAINRKASDGGDALPPNSPWEMALDHWWQAVSPAASEKTRGFMSKMMEQGKQFFRMAELFSGSERPEGEAPDWMDVLERVSRGLGSVSGEGADSESPDQICKMMGFWEMPLDNWQRIAATLSLMPVDLFGNHSSGGPQMVADRLFTTPGLGYTREEQAQQQALIRLIREYLRALQEYSRFFSDIGSESVRRLREKLRQGTDGEEVIESARALYDIWVTTCEEVYSERVMDPDYARINGQLVNTSLSVKRHVSTMIDDKLDSLNMPTRREIRTLQARMQENRRENKSLRAELDMLTEQLAGLLASETRATPARSTAKRKTAPRKKSSVKS